MTEEQAREWLIDTFGARSYAKLESFVSLLLEEATQQSLIAKSTFESVWSRHVADSAQLVSMARAGEQWIDVGSGGGLPGIVVAILRDAPILLVEPRKKRAEFLRKVYAKIELTNVTVLQATAQTARVRADILSARAVANLADLFAWTSQIVSRETQFLLPRGENATSDLALVRRTWQGKFHVKQSITDPRAGIVIANEVRPR